MKLKEETIPARFGLIWFSRFRGEDLNVIFYQNMPNLHNRYISAELILTYTKAAMNNYNFIPCD
jgi:hypothetical protein